MRRGWKRAVWTGLVAVVLAAGIAGWHLGGVCENSVQAADRPVSAEKTLAVSEVMLLRWTENLNAVKYEVELLPSIPPDLQRNEPHVSHVYDNDQIYSDGVMIDLAKEAPQALGKPLYWRVRPKDLDGNPIGDFTQPALYVFRGESIRNSPIPRAMLGGEKGTDILYPVYSFIGNPGAAGYEIEITDEWPENLDDIGPSVHRVYAGHSELTDFYDPSPRIGHYYWRVRGLSADGLPVGIWSQPQPFETKSSGWLVGIYGDSISHGGGHLSFGPADWAYSYEYYLDHPVINLAESGDTSAMMVERFDRDVAPFQELQTLFILGGTNSLRGGVPAADVIRDLKEIQKKCRARGITPVLMTLPPINPDNIRRAFHEDTDDGWREAFDEVNAFIRTQPHVDTAAPFAEMETMPTELALDGLHGDWNAKQMMAGEINTYMKEHGI